MILLFRSYWDNDKGSFLPAPSSDSQSATPAAAADKEDKKEKPEKQDKVVNNYFNFWLENDYYFVSKRYSLNQNFSYTRFCDDLTQI